MWRNIRNMLLEVIALAACAAAIFIASGLALLVMSTILKGVT